MFQLLLWLLSCRIFGFTTSFMVCARWSGVFFFLAVSANETKYHHVVALLDLLRVMWWPSSGIPPTQGNDTTHSLPPLCWRVGWETPLSLSLAWMMASQAHGTYAILARNGWWRIHLHLHIPPTVAGSSASWPRQLPVSGLAGLPLTHWRNGSHSPGY